MSSAISPKELEEALKGGAKLIDVRAPAEFREAHVQGAKNIPLDRLDAKEFQQEGVLYIICNRGSRGKKACEQLLAAGVAGATNVEGGTRACDEAGLPMVRGKETMSLERQVRIGAGSLVVVGVALGWFVAPVWFGLAAFVGAGLVFAGVTDTCAMGMMIARMPWNQAGCDGGSCATK